MSKSLAVVGGAMGGGGGSSPPAHVPITSPDSIRSQAIIEVVEAWGWGEMKCFPDGADPLEYVRLNGTPIKSNGVLNFEGVTFDYRTGTQNQTYIQGILNDAVGSPISVGLPVTNSTPVIYTISDPSTDALRVIVSFNALVVQNMTTGDKTAANVNLQIEARASGGVWTLIDLKGRGTIFDKTESPYQRSFRVNLRAIDPVATSYDIRVSRLSADPLSNENSAFSLDTIVKLTHAKLRRPNVAYCRLTFDTKYFSSVPTRSYDLMGWLIQVPTADVYDPVLRTYTGVDWVGTLTKRWCRNPAWFLYHLLTTAGAGLGDEINQAYQDKWAIYTIAKRCDELVDDGNGGLEPRYSIDAQFMAQTSAHDMVMQIAGIFDAQALWNGTSVYLTQDAPKAVSSLYLPANVVGGRFSYAGTARQVRYTAAIIQYNDTTDQYKLTTEYVEDFDGIQRYGFRPKTETAVGCISRGEAHRRGKRLLVTGRREIDSVSFTAGLGGINDKPGDIIRIADPLRSAGARLGGRLNAGSTTTVIQLDSSVTLAAGISYRLALIGNSGAIKDTGITSAAGAHTSVSVSPALTTAPDSGQGWIVYDPLAIGKTYRVLSITENDNADNGLYTLSATQYDIAKFAEIDDISNLEAIPPNPYLPGPVMPPTEITVSEGVYTALEGLRRFMDIHWTASNDSLLRGYLLKIKHNGATIFDGEVTGQSFRLNNPLAGTYKIKMSSVTITGKYSASVIITHVLGEMYAIESVSITGLALKSGGSTFAGKIAEFVWGTDALAVLGFSDTYAIGDGGQSPWFRDFQVDVYTPGLDPVLLRSDFVTESAYAYTYEKNIEDGGPRRQITLKVRARDYYGRYSISQSVTVSNPAPPELLVNNVHIYAGYKSLIIEYLRPPDNDWVGVIVFLGTETGFAPSEANRIYMGSDTTITIPDLLENTPYFLRLATYDAFGGASDYTLGATEYTKTIISVAMADPVEIKNGLQAALNDPAITPLIFEADTFALKLAGTDIVPFIVGVHNEQPAILMDANVVVTGDLSASQIKSGRMAATEILTVGNGNAIINGDGSIFVYNGDDTISNRDFAILSGGTLSFQRHRGGEYREYKAVKRIEYGEAASGTTVTLPGYWDSQPKIKVSPDSLQSYNAAQSGANQSWQIRADNLVEIFTSHPTALTLSGNADISGLTVSKSYGYGNPDTWDAQAYSNESLTGGAAVKFRFNVKNLRAIVGLSTNVADPGISQINFGLYANPSGGVQVYESGISVATYGSFLTSDLFRIDYNDSLVQYKKNGVIFHTSAAAPGLTLRVDSSIYADNMSFTIVDFVVYESSKQWKFDAVAELNYSSSAGNTAVALTSGVLGTDTWNSGQSTPPANAVSLLVSAQFSSVKGNGTSTHGYYYRTVIWKTQGWNGVSWVDLGTNVYSISKAEHAKLINDQMAINITAGTYSAIRLNFVAKNTNGSTYSNGGNVYNYAQNNAPVDPTTGGVNLSPLFGGNSATSYSTTNNGVTYTTQLVLPAYTAPVGWEIYAINYSATWYHNNNNSLGSYYAGGVLFKNSNAAGSGAYSSGAVSATSYNRNFWSMSIYGYSGNTAKMVGLDPESTTIYLRQLIANSATVANAFTFQSYAWNIAGSTAIAVGSLNWMAVGD